MQTLIKAWRCRNWKDVSNPAASILKRLSLDPCNALARAARDDEPTLWDAFELVSPFEHSRVAIEPGVGAKQIFYYNENDELEDRILFGDKDLDALTAFKPILSAREAVVERASVEVRIAESELETPTDKQTIKRAIDSIAIEQLQFALDYMEAQCEHPISIISTILR